MGLMRIEMETLEAIKSYCRQQVSENKREAWVRNAAKDVVCAMIASGDGTPHEWASDGMISAAVEITQRIYEQTKQK